MTRLVDGEPGACYRVEDEFGRWAVWKVLDGDDLAFARELGYDEGVIVACVSQCGRSTRAEDGTPAYIERATAEFLSGHNFVKVPDEGVANLVLNPGHPQYEEARALNQQMIDAAYKMHELGVTEEILVDQVRRALHV